MLRTVVCPRCGTRWFDGGPRDRLRVYQCPNCGKIVLVRPSEGQTRLSAFERV